jgi:alpha-galactosidase
MKRALSSVAIFAMLLVAFQFEAQRLGSSASIESPGLRIEFDKNMHSRVIARVNGKDVPTGAFSASETVKGNQHSWENFALTSQKRERITDTYGAGQKLTLVGTSGALRKNLTVTIYDESPNLAVFEVSYTNVGKSPLEIADWSNNHYTIDAQPASSQAPFWSFQSGSYERRPNWILPLHPGFSQQNYLGMNATDYGGGTPIIDVWRKDIGIGVGHVEPRPHLISLPVSMPDARQAEVSVQSRHQQSMQPGETFHTFRTFVPCTRETTSRRSTYRRFMMKQGFQMAKAPDERFGAIWCAWGYGRSVQPQQVYDTLPTAKRLGFKWVTLDDGWQNNVRRLAARSQEVSQW